MSFFHKLSCLFFPPRCVACRELMRIDKADHALCPKCYPKWRRATHMQCKQCYLPYFDCRCVLPNMKRVGIDMHVKLTPYDEVGRENATAHRMILRMKTSNREEIFSFMAKELEIGVRHAVETSCKLRQKQGLPPLETVIAYLPRTRHNLLESGVDQARQLALALSRVTGIPLKRAILRKHDDRVQQKLLSAKERLKNMRDVFTLGESVAGMRVLLVDDIVTTGVTMGEAARLLNRAGAAEIIAVSVACTELHH